MVAGVRKPCRSKPLKIGFISVWWGARVHSTLLCGLLTLVAAGPPPSGRIILPGLGATPQREMVKPEGMPWSAVAKINMVEVGSCTGVLIAPTVMLTAGHCMFDQRTRHFIRPSQIHVLLGYNQGEYTTHVVVSRYRLADGYIPRLDRKASSADVAILEFDKPVSASVVPLSEGDAVPGQAIMLGGYAQDRSQVVLADTGCVVRDLVTVGPGELLEHDCAATHGTSGGPVFSRGADGRWRVVGVNVAARPDALGGAAIPASFIRSVMKRQP